MNRTPMSMLALATLAFLVAAPVAAQEATQETTATPSPVQVQFDITTGGVFRDITNQHSSRFQYGRDVPEGFYLENFFFQAEQPGRPWYLSISALDAGERDQRFRLLYDRFGRYRLDVRWDQFSVFVADNFQTLHVTTSPGVLEVPDLIQTQFEAATDADLPGLVQSVLDVTRFADMFVLRRKLGVYQEFRPARHWRLFADFGYEIRSGDRPVTVGSYQRTNTPLGDLYFTPGMEVPEPIDYRTTTIKAGVAYEGERGFVEASYRGSFFDNRIQALIFDNPFRITDQLASRFRLERTSLQVYPDNDSHTLSFLGGYSFEPWHTRLTGALSFSWWDQNDAFLPFTFNTALVAPPGDLPAGTTPTDLAALPQPSLNGEAFVTNGDVALTTRPSNKLLIAARYNAYDWDEQSDEIEFPGFAAVGDSIWEEQHGALPITNRLKDFLRQRSGVEVVWKPRDALHWKNEFEWEGWDRDNREILRMNEWMWNTQLIFKSKKRFYGKLQYHYGDRIPRGLYNSRKEFTGLRKFDVAARIQNKADILFQVNPNRQVSFSGSYGYRSNRYDDSFFGQATDLLGFFTVDANVIPNDRFAGYVNFTRERSRSSARLVSKTGAFNNNPANTFLRDLNDRVNSFGGGFDANFLDYRLNWNVSYASALSQIAIDTVNPFIIDVQATLNATAFPLPDIKENFHEVRTTVRYRLRDNVEVGARYLFEPRSLSDFTTDIFETPYIAGLEAPEDNLNRYLFTNSRQSSYHGHAAAVFLRYTF